MKTKDLMRGRWASALREYGMDEKQLSGKHCECPLCGGKDRFRFDNKDGLGTWYCNNCGAGDGFKLLARITGLSFAEVASDLDKRAGNYDQAEQPKADTSKLIGMIASGLGPISDIDPVVLYLRHRGIQRIPREFLRYNPAAFHWGERRKFPAMVAAMRDVIGKVRGYHITYLNDRGGKASIDKARLYTPGQTGECAIRLSPVCAHLGLAEGIETALSVTQMFGIPCWATGDAGRLEKFSPPEGVERITVFADIDVNHTGEAAAEALVRRLIMNHSISCEVRRDCPRGTDYNDLLLSQTKEVAHG